MLLLIIIAVPFLTFLLLQFGENVLGKYATKLSIAQSFIVAVCTVAFNFQSDFQTLNSLSYAWLRLGEQTISLSLHIDTITLRMLLVVNSIAALVQLFSFSYMERDKNIIRYFSYLSFFTFSMNALLIADNLLVLYIFWEFVGFSSYLLIGFWQEKPSAASAAKKAFLMNRIGDAGFLIALMVLYATFETLSLRELAALITPEVLANEFILHVAGLGFLLSLMAKSAQLPLATWLPDAMEGPTPVSALIHAATMVAAGVYLMVRVYFMLPFALVEIMLFVGLITALLSSFAATVQTDIKKVLAYSTISQLGFMVVALGVGFPQVALFHLVTHAFFKALLFLSAGAIIHGLHHIDGDPQDLRNMGGLSNVFPVTHIALVCGSAALIGLPLFSGFLSKEAILIAASNFSFTFNILCIAIFFTAFYTTRMVYFTMWAKPSKAVKNLTSTPLKLPIKLPLIILSIASVWLVFAPSPVDAFSNYWLNLGNIEGKVVLVFAASMGLSFLGIALALFSAKSLGITPIYRLQNYLFHFLGMDKTIYGFAKLSVFISKMTRNFDQKILDRLIDNFAVFLVMIGHATRWIDKYVVDGFISIVSFSLGKSGVVTGNLQGKSVQGLLIVSLSILSLFIAVFLVILG